MLAAVPTGTKNLPAIHFDAAVPTLVAITEVVVEVQVIAYPVAVVAAPVGVPQSVQLSALLPVLPAVKKALAKHFLPEETTIF